MEPTCFYITVIHVQTTAGHTFSDTYFLLTRSLNDNYNHLYTVILVRSVHPSVTGSIRVRPSLKLQNGSSMINSLPHRLCATQSQEREKYVINQVFT